MGRKKKLFVEEMAMVQHPYGSLARRQENARTWDRDHRNRKVAEVRNVSISACGKSTLAAHKRPARSKNDWRQGTGGGTKKFAAEANAITEVPAGQTKPKSLPGKPKSLPGKPKVPCRGNQSPCRANPVLCKAQEATQKSPLPGQSLLPKSLPGNCYP